MNFFSFDFRKFILAMVLVMIPLLLINMERKIGEPQWYEAPFVSLGGLLQRGYFSFSSGVRGTTALYLNLINIKKQNRELLNSNAQLRAQLGELTELRLENERLSQLLQFKKKTKMELLAAKVVGKDLLPEYRTLTINRGSEHGLQKNMAAITIGGVVGYVFRAQSHSSQILLLTDRYSSIDSLVQRSRARGLVEGRSKDNCRLKYLRRDDDVKVGDLIVTSGLGNIFPKGFPVGTVKMVKKGQYEMSQTVEVEPVVNPEALEEIFVVVNPNREDFTPEVAKKESATAISSDQFEEKDVSEAGE